MGRLGRVLAPFGGLLGRLWLIVGAPRPILGRFGGLLGRLRPVLGASWRILGHLGCVWKRLGSSLGRLGPSRAHLGIILESSWGVWDRRVDVLARPRGPSLGRLGTSCGRLSRILGHLGDVLGAIPRKTLIFDLFSIPIPETGKFKPPLQGELDFSKIAFGS